MGQSSTASISQCACCVSRELDDRGIPDRSSRSGGQRKPNEIKQKIEKVYFFEAGCLGSGSVATVRKARLRHRWDIIRAVKQVDKVRIKCTKTIGCEIGILMTLDHPNICKMFEYYVDRQFIHLVMEFIQGHDLEHEIDENIRLKRYDEARYSVIVSQLLDAVKYCHDVGVVHRDLKPANIMVCDTTIEYMLPSIKLIDFGLALEGSPNAGHNTGRLEGGIAYLAPEVYHATVYSEASDMYSIGVIMFVMLLERFPSSKVPNDVLEIESLDGRDLVSGLLKRDPRLRLIAAQAAKHPWTQQHRHIQRNGSQKSLKMNGSQKLLKMNGSQKSLQRSGSQDAYMKGTVASSAESDQMERWLTDLSRLSLNTSGSINDVAGITTEEFDGMFNLSSNHHFR